MNACRKPAHAPQRPTPKMSQSHAQIRTMQHTQHQAADLVAKQGARLEQQQYQQHLQQQQQQQEQVHGSQKASESVILQAQIARDVLVPFQQVVERSSEEGHSVQMSVAASAATSKPLSKAAAIVYDDI